MQKQRQRHCCQTARYRLIRIWSLKKERRRRVRTAQLVPAPASTDKVAFGSTVTFVRGDGRMQKYRIVGEDEADPKAGSISYVSPVAQSVLGKTVGDVVAVGRDELEIVAIT